MKSKSTVKIFDKVYEFELQNPPRVQSFSPKFVHTVTMCIHISSECNLNCKYCFRQNVPQLKFSDAARFIELVTTLYPHADRYIVDLSGAGEPLLHKDLILEIAEFCKRMSDKYVREFLPTLATNGTLLNAETVEELQHAGVLFGVSLDGTREKHNRNRVFSDGRGSYDIVEQNIKNIKNKTYVGAALTYSDGGLLESFLNAFALLPTVSMKPVRSFDNSLDADAVCESYAELILYVLEKTLDGDVRYVYALINGEDYFGKFLKRVAVDTNVYGRCDAGIGRFALAGNRNIYCCPAGLGIDECKVGDLDSGIRQSKVEKFWRGQLNAECDGCYARSACGGECKIVSYYRYGRIDGLDANMCKIKKYLYAAAMYFIDKLKNGNSNIYNWLISETKKINSYYDADDRLIETVEASQGKYTFTQLKKIKDENIEDFEKIRREVYENRKIL